MNWPVSARGTQFGETVRVAAEFLICVALTLLLTTTWLVEPFIVPSSSMAPTLLGPHRRLTCPECGFEYVCGSGRYDSSAGRTLCPNCNAPCATFEKAPVAQGDRILVLKQAFRQRDPRRWEVVVFRRRGLASQAYVKRVAGLPGESIQIRRGEVFINGELERKDLAAQRALAILVHAAAHEPHGVRSRWSGFPGSTAWLNEQGTFTWPGTEQALADVPNLPRIDWLEYHHRERLFGSPTDVVETAVTDTQPYNQLDTVRAADELRPVRDGRITCTVQATGAGRLLFRAGDDRDSLVAQLDVATGAGQLFHNGLQVQEWQLPGPLFAQPTPVEFAWVDRQVWVVINGQAVAPPLAFPWEERPTPETTRPWAIGVAGPVVTIDHLRVYRDVYYTDPGWRLGPQGREPCWGVQEPYQLGPDEFFALGDNSSFSEDSRSWREGPGVPRSALVGKALVVHLPSRWREWGTWFQVPDWEHIRYIR